LFIFSSSNFGLSKKSSIAKLFLCFSVDFIDKPIGVDVDDEFRLSTDLNDL